MEYLAKKVVDAGSGKVIGFVLDLAIDLQKLSLYGLFVVDEETEGEYLLRFEDIERVGDVVLVSDFSKLEFVPLREKNLLGREVIGLDGRSFGAVDRLTFDRKKLKFVYTNKAQIPTKLISFVGEDCIFLKGRRKKIVKPNPFIPVVDEPKVEIMKVEKTNVAPEKINLSYSFFAGKLATEDVFGYNNERIVLKNEKITKIIFENAKKHNKLNELFFSIKK